MVKQCGGWRRRGTQFGTQDRCEAADDCCPAKPGAIVVSVEVEETNYYTATFTFTRTGSTTDALTVSIGVTGTADSGTDFSIGSTSSVTFEAGSRTATLVVEVLPNCLNREEEFVLVSVVPSIYGGYDVDLGNYFAMATITAPCCRDVRSYGVEPDTGADVSTLIRSMLTTVASEIGTGGSATLVWPAGTYILTITSSIEVPPGIGFECEDGVVFEKTSSGSGGALFDFIGTTTSITSALSGDGTAGDATVTVANGALFAAGDYVKVSDSTFHVTGSLGRNEELNRIVSISSNTLTLRTPLINAYATASSAAVTTVYPITQTIRGGEYVVPQGSSGGGIRVELGYGNLVEGVAAVGPNASPGIHLFRCRGSRVMNCAAYDGQNQGTSGRGYGFDIAESSYDVTVAGFCGQNLRECLITGHCRQIKVIGCTFEDFADSGVNTHNSGNSEVLIANNICARGVGGGIIVGIGTTSLEADRNVTIRGNLIRDVAGNGIVLQCASSPSPQTTDGFVVEGNVIENVGTSGSDLSGILVSRVTDVQVIGNRIDGQDNGNLRFGIRVADTDRCIVANNIVRRVTGTSPSGIRWSDCETLALRDNIVTGVGGENYTSSGTSTDVVAMGNLSDDTNVNLNSNAFASNNQFGTGTTPHVWAVDTLGNVMQLSTGGLLGVGQTTITHKVDVLGTGNDGTSGGIRARNTTNNTAARARFNAESATSSGEFAAYPALFATAALADRVALVANSDAAGLSLYANSTGQDIRMVADSVEMLRLSANKIATGQSAAGTVLGSVARKLQLFDLSGNSIGFVPLYDSIS